MQQDLFPVLAGHDPGGKIRLRLQSGVVGWAEFSSCGRYRHLLGRRWDDAQGNVNLPPFALLIGMNPSTADVGVDDPTVRREVEFTRSWDLSCLLKFNLMDYRATHPKDLLDPDIEPRSNHNLRYIITYSAVADRIVLCYGVLAPKLRRYATETVDALRKTGRELWCLGLCKDGLSPRHPLYLRKDTPLERVTWTASKEISGESPCGANKMDAVIGATSQ